MGKKKQPEHSFPRASDIIQTYSEEKNYQKLVDAINALEKQKSIVGDGKILHEVEKELEILTNYLEQENRVLTNMKTESETPTRKNLPIKSATVSTYYTMESTSRSDTSKYKFSKNKIRDVQVPLSDTIHYDDLPTLKWVKAVAAIAKSLLLNFRFPHNFRLEPENAILAFKTQPETDYATEMKDDMQDYFELQQLELKIDMEIQDYEDYENPEFPLKRKFRSEDTNYVGEDMIVAEASFMPLSLESLFRSIVNDLINLLKGICKVVRKYLQDINRGTKLIHFTNLFVEGVTQVPPVANFFNDDEFFAHMQVGGPNPLMIAKLSAQKLQEKLGTLAEKAGQISVAGTTTLLQACNANQVYYADYEILAKVLPGENKYTQAPLAVFIAKKGSLPQKYLHPVFIKLHDQEHIFTPKDGVAWKMAKTIVMSAYSNHHELISHLGNTHLFIEVFVVATFRAFKEKHPVLKLLKPHFEGTLFINDAATKTLINRGGAVDKLLAGEITSELKLLESGFKFNNMLLKNSLKNRDVEDAELYYPYRDYALLLWDAIETWVRKYIDIYYPNDDSIVADPAIKDWCVDIQTDEGGCIKDFDIITTKPKLVEAITMIIFTASVQHAAVNYPQGDMMTFAPAFPLQTKKMPPFSETLTDENWFELLPDLTTSQLQLNVGYLLGQVHYTTLGNYSKYYFDNLRIQKALVEFWDDLKSIQEQIQDKNATQIAVKEFYGYKYLLPQDIPQSINI